MNPTAGSKKSIATRLFRSIVRALKPFTAEIPKEHVLKFGTEAAFGRYKPFFPDAAIAHPAKANLAMIEWIIKQYTKEGDTVLDVMSGTFSTCVVAALNNRNAIGVELEEKFYNWGLDAKRRIETTQTLAQKGRMVVLRGDARELSKVLAENADAIVFSPPFASEQFASKSEDRKEYFKKCGGMGSAELRRDELYQSGKNNVGNMPYGADAVVFSPPFVGEQSDPKGAAGGGAATCKKKYGYAAHYEADENIADLPYGAGGIDVVLFSPPFTNEPFADKVFMRRGHPERGGKPFTQYTDFGEDDIGGLPYGTLLNDGGILEVSAVVFSPPFGEANRGGGIAIKGYDKDGKHADIHLGLDRPLSDSPDNISNLDYGSIDAIVTSPPYSEQVSTKGDPERRAERMMAAGLNPKTIVGGKARCGELDFHYGGGKNNIGNLPHGHADAIVTSPPYEGSLESTSRHTKGGIPERDAKMGKTGLYAAENKDNIGNLKADTYLGAMLQVYVECFKVLKPGGVMVLITKNFVRQKKVVRLDLDTIKLCEAAGFTYVERWYRKLEHPSFWRIIYAKKFHYCPRCSQVFRVRKSTSDRPSLSRCVKCEVPLLPALLPFEDILVFRRA